MVRPQHETERSACPCLQSAKQIIELLEVSLKTICWLPMMLTAVHAPEAGYCQACKPVCGALAAQQHLLQSCMLVRWQSSIMPAGYGLVPIAHPAACQVLKCAGLQKEESNLTDDDIAHMKHVNAYCKVRILACSGLVSLLRCCQCCSSLLRCTGCLSSRSCPQLINNARHER